MENIHDIYDRVAKRCISLSSRCTINLINGLYGTDYPIDSEVTYNWTENEDDELKRTLADTIITINKRNSYHMEFQMTKDGDIVLRVLEYGFHHAMKHWDADTLHFPEPLIMYLYNKEKVADEYALRICFGTQGEFIYKVPVYKYLEKSLEELDNKKMIVLLPFQLLRLRQAIEKERTPANIDALKNLLAYDIIDTLERNEHAGNITQVESMKLRSMILHLYRHIYQKYDELEKEGVNQMAEDALIFDVDILDYKIRKLEKKTQELEATQQSLEKKAQNLEAANQSLEEANQNLEETNQSLEETNQNLEAAKLSLEKANQVWKLYAKGNDVKSIAAQTDLTEEEIEEILGS